MKHLALLLLLGCATSHEAHSEAKIEAANQEEVRLETHTEEGAWSVRTWLFAPGPSSPGGSDPRASAVYELGGIVKLAPGTVDRRAAPDVPGTLPKPSDIDHPSFLGWPTEGEVISYSEEVHQPTVIDATKNAKANASLNASSAAENSGSTKWGLSLVTKLGIALGLGLALWMARKRIRALLPF